ncbi:hypothetical protein [Pseudomonas sp. 43(2021)]|nr:hypothetical protein [Pseudomonas sp. 43(2021)]
MHCLVLKAIIELGRELPVDLRGGAWQCGSKAAQERSAPIRQ